MSFQGIKQLPLALRVAKKADVRTQFAALCYRVHKDKPEVLLITSRGSHRWIIPKGWPMVGETPSAAAATEAWEEAGVKGRVYDQCLGLYSYQKETDEGLILPCVAMVYPIKVKSLAAIFPERKQRKRRWFSRKKAAAAVDEPELASILKSFDPRLLRA